MEFNFRYPTINKHIVSIRNVNCFIVFLFILFSIFTPADNLNIKKVSLLFLLIMNANYLAKKSLNRKYYVIGFHIFVFFPILALISILVGGDIVATISGLYFVLVAGVNIIIERYKINYEKYFFSILKIMVLIMVGSFILDLLNILDIYNNSFLMYLYETDNAMIGKSSIYWSGYILFLKASPLLIFLEGYSLFKEKYILSIFTVIALVLSGTRANFFASFIMLFIFLLINHKNILLKIIIIFLSLLIILTLFDAISSFFTYMFSSKLGSRIDKILDIKEILNVFKEYPHTFFLGTGFGSEIKYGMTHTISEVSLLDLWRKIGFFGLIMFLYYIFKPIFRIWKVEDNRWVVYSFSLYLAIAMTNPLFFSTTAYLAYIFIYYKYYEQYEISHT